MVAKAKTPSARSASNGLAPPRNGLAPAYKGLAPARNGLGPERVIEIQRGRILAAMVEVAAERGAGNVTVAHIVERAGVSRRTFYELYRDREECFLAAFDEAFARASRYVLDHYDPDSQWAERIRMGLIGLLSFFDSERGAGRLLIVGSLGAGASALERRREVLAQAIVLVDEGRELAKSGYELPPLTAEGIVGGVLSVLHVRLLDSEDDPLLELTGPLMSMIVLPYLGPAAARRELTRVAPPPLGLPIPVPADPLRDVQMRLTYRTVRVLAAVAVLGGQGTHPSNREIGMAADIQDQGQISKLLTRLARLGLIENTGAGIARGAPNAWTLTPKGAKIESAIANGAG